MGDRHTEINISDVQVGLKAREEAGGTIKHILEERQEFQCGFGLSPSRSFSAK